jgi:tyrosine-protein kinase Etk/Wzc
MSNPIVYYEFPNERRQLPPVIGPDDDNDQVDVWQYFRTLYESRWLIILCVFIALVCSALYVMAVRPVYESNFLVHVEEEGEKKVNTTFADMGAMFNVKASANAEVELVKSRLVVSRALDKLNMYVDARPEYFPIKGNWLASNDWQLPIPPGFGGYAWSGDTIKIGAFNIPDPLLNQEFMLTTGENGQFKLVNEGAGIAADGKVGEPLRIAFAGGQIELLVADLHAPPGIRFQLRHSSRLAMVDKIFRNLTVMELGKQSGVINVSLRGADPKWISVVLAEIANQYFAQNKVRRTQEAHNALEFLNKQLPDLKRQLEESETRYNQFRTSRGTVDLGEEAKSDLQQVVAAKSRKADLEQKRNELLVRFTENHPVVIGIDTQLREVNAEIRNLNSHIKSLPLVEQELLKLSRDLKINTELYTSLLNTARQLRLVTVSATSNVRMIDMPVVPERPISGGWQKIFGIGLMAGLMAGIAAAMLRKSMRRGVEDPLQIEQMVNLPVYASIPLSDAQKQLQRWRGIRARQVPLLAKEAPNDEAMEGLRKFRAVMQHLSASSNNASSNNNISLLLSPTAGNGKSFVSANLAVLLGLGNKRVLLIDADLRNGDMHRYFNVAQECGLTEALSGMGNIEKLLHSEVAPNVDLITSGTLPRESELLLTPALQSLLRLLAPRYDMVLINGAPLLEVSDSLAIGAHAGAVYVVARAGVSTIREISETVRQLRQAGLTAKGCLFNGAQPRSQRRAYQYKYTYSKHWNVEYLSGPRRSPVTLTKRSG